MRLRTRPTRVLAAIAAVSSIGLAACGGSSNSSGTTTPAGTGGASVAPPTDSGDNNGAADKTLRVLVHQNPPMVEFMESFNKKFEADSGWKVDMTVVKPDELSNTTQTLLTANEVDVVDMFGFANGVQDYMGDATPPGWQTLIDGGLLMDITDQPFVANYDATSINDAGTYNNKVYSVNLGRVSYSGMFVNQDLLAEVGAAIPTTWDELVAVCKTVIDAGKSCMTVGGADTWPVHVGASGILGAAYPDQGAFVKGLWDGSAKWNDDASRALLEKFKTYSENMLESDVTSLSHDDAIGRYAEGDVAFSPTGVWQAPALEDAKPSFEWTYVPVPGSNNPDNNKYLFGKYDMGWSINAKSANTDAAVKYLTAFSEPANYQEFVNAVGFIPTQPGATLDTKLGKAVAPYVENFKVGFEQYWVEPSGAGQWAEASKAAAWFKPFGEWDDANALADRAQGDLQAGLDS